MYESGFYETGRDKSAMIYIESREGGEGGGGGGGGWEVDEINFAATLLPSFLFLFSIKKDRSISSTCTSQVKRNASKCIVEERAREKL